MTIMVMVSNRDLLDLLSGDAALLILAEDPEGLLVPGLLVTLPPGLRHHIAKLLKSKSVFQNGS